MTQTNSDITLNISVSPETSGTPTYLPLLNVNSLLHNVSIKKEDKVYFHNGGNTTSVNTGRTDSISVSIDYNKEDPLHSYLKSLLFNMDISKSNNQKIQLEISNSGAVTTITGTACIQFKNGIPSGAADETTKLDFDIFPQDNTWIVEIK